MRELPEKIKLEYSDQNEYFNKVFPAQICSVLNKFYSAHANNWLLVKLEKPFHYEDIYNTHLIVRSRWAECEIGEKEPVSVFILLIPDFSYLTEPLDIGRLDHVAWGMVYTDFSKSKWQDFY